MTQIPANTPDDPLHREIQELLPWYANGTLNSAEAARVASHVGECPHCRNALEQCRLLAVAVKDADENTWTPAAMQFSELMRRVDAAEALRIKPHGWAARVKAWFGWVHTTPGPARWALGLQGALVLLLGSAWLLEPLERSGYQTMSSAPPRTAADQSIFKIVFADSITEKELRGLLQSVSAEIIAGPSATGVYTLRMSKQAAVAGVQRAVLTLRAHPQVQLVEELHP